MKRTRCQMSAFARTKKRATYVETFIVCEPEGTVRLYRDELQAAIILSDEEKLELASILLDDINPKAAQRHEALLRGVILKAETNLPE